MAREQVRANNQPEPERDVVASGVWLYRVRGLTVAELAFLRISLSPTPSPFMVCASFVAFGLEQIERAPLTGEVKPRELPRETITFPDGNQHEVVAFSWFKGMTPDLLNKLTCRIAELSGLLSKEAVMHGQ